MNEPVVHSKKVMYSDCEESTNEIVYRYNCKPYISELRSRLKNMTRVYHGTLKKAIVNIYDLQLAFNCLELQHDMQYRIS